MNNLFHEFLKICLKVMMFTLNNKQMFNNTLCSDDDYDILKL